MSSVPCTTKQEYIAYIHNYSHLRALYIVYYRIHKPSTFYDQHLAAVGKKTYLYNCKKNMQQNQAHAFIPGKIWRKGEDGKEELNYKKKALSLMWPVKPVGLLCIVSNASYSNTDCMNLLAFSYCNTNICFYAWSWFAARLILQSCWCLSQRMFNKWSELHLHLVKAISGR